MRHKGDTQIGIGGPSNALEGLTGGQVFPTLPAGHCGLGGLHALGQFGLCEATHLACLNQRTCQGRFFLQGIIGGLNGVGQFLLLLEKSLSFILKPSLHPRERDLDFPARCLLCLLRKVRTTIKRCPCAAK